MLSIPMWISQRFVISTIYFSVLGGEDEAQNTLEGLNNAKVYPYRASRRVRMRHTPDISSTDSSLERGRGSMRSAGTGHFATS